MLDRVADALGSVPVPGRWRGVRLVLMGHIVARALRQRASGAVLRRAALHLGLMEAALWTMGREGMTLERGAFLPLFVLPDYHGPHFDEGLRRLLLPGRGPLVINLAVSGVCPCRCSYCYAAVGEPDIPDLGDERLFEVARAIVRSHVPLVLLGGGEPMMRFDRLLAIVRILAPTCEVRVTTSGVGMTAARAQALRDAGVSVVAVSLDTHDAAVFDATRGYVGAHAAAVQALRSCADAGLVTFVTAVASRTATERGVAAFLSFVSAIHPGVLVNFLPKFATGRALTDDGFRVPEEYAGVSKSITRAIVRGGHRATVFRAPFELMVGCVGGGLRQMNVDVRGNVAACISGASFGNVLEESFDVLYGRYVRAAGRLKRGFFCASIGDRAGGATVLTPAESLRALEDFHGAHRDTLMQRVIDLGEGPLAWLAESGARSARS